MIPINEALKIISEKTEPIGVESISIDQALGRVLAEDIVADTDLPPFNRAQMDGYALRAVDTETAPVRLRIVGESIAGRGWHKSIKEGEAIRIMTGAPVPDGADTVEQVELTRELNNGTVVEIEKSVSINRHIVKQGSEVKRGTEVLNRGETIRAAMISVLAAFGYAQVKVYKRPRVTVLATGSELVDVNRRPGIDEIRDSNSYSLSILARIAGAEVNRLPLVGDDENRLKETILNSVETSDALVLSGGVSMGLYDFTKTSLRELGAEIFFERVALKPGKPTVFAKLGNSLIFGLPGNPVSVAVTFYLFTRMALRIMQGDKEPMPKEETAILGKSVKGAGERASYIPARLNTNDNGSLIAEPLRWGGSSDFIGFSKATALIIVDQGIKLLEAGSKVKIVQLV
jgi:molybdopterin molybdotransferase